MLPKGFREPSLEMINEVMGSDRILSDPSSGATWSEAVLKAYLSDAQDAEEEETEEGEEIFEE